MKILILNSQILYPWWYYGRYSVYFLMKHLRKKGVEIYLSFPVNDIESNTPNIKHLESLELKVYPFEMDTSDSIFKLIRNFFEKEPFKIKKYFNAKYLGFLSEICDEIKPDLIQVYSSHMFKLGFKIAKRLNVPIVLKQQDIVHNQIKSFMENVQNPIYKLIAKWQYTKTHKYEIKIWQKADRIIFLTFQDLKYFFNICPDFKYKAIVIPDGVEPYDNLYLRNHKKLNGFCFMASDQIPNIISLKWFLNLWKKISNKTNLTFHIYGKVCDSFKKEESNLQKYNVILHGFIKDKEKLNNELSKYLFFISPTISGAGYRTKILDVASFGMPIICTEFDYKSIDFLFEKEREILTFRHESDLLNIIDKIEKKQIKLEILSENLHKKVQTKLAWSTIADSFIEVYSELLRS